MKQINTMDHIKALEEGLVHNYRKRMNIDQHHLKQELMTKDQLQFQILEDIMIEVIYQLKYLLKIN